MKNKEKYSIVKSLFEEGTTLYAEKRFDEAENKLKEALDLAPKSEEIMYNLALVYVEKEKYKLALDLVNKIEKINCKEIIKILKNAGYTDIKGGIPIRWLDFYTYGKIPFVVLILIISFINILVNYSKVNNPLLYLFLIIFEIIIAIVLFIGLHKRRLWGWKFNWFALFFEVLTITIPIANNVNEYLIIVCVFLVIWFLPNFIYFKKRKMLFS